jgi:2,4-dienoyl-CoA reductase-like NADH-dependent reductase (Old Yellow Enzyme family)
VLDADRAADGGQPVVAVGGITPPEGADALVRNERADLAVVGREHLRDPYFAIRAARELGHEAPVPRQYTRGFD